MRPGKDPRSPPGTQPKSASAPAAERSPGRRLGFASLALAFGAAAALSLRHLGAAPLPGCGLDSPCERALSGPFGALPWIDWPVAFLGSSFFAGGLAAWSLAGAGWPRSLRWLVRAGGLASVAFLVLAFQQGTPCPFCITSQLANLVFVFCSERASGPARARRPELAFVLAVLVTTALITFARTRASARQGAAAEQELADSTRAIEQGTGVRAFTGRYRRGPERAPLRLVLFTDYQCPDCALIEGQAWALLEERAALADLSLSIKHFPLCKDCNRRARDLGQNPHPNACWAARAAEAAGIVGGDEAFWRMHRWLFERRGKFTDADLRTGLASLGLAAGAFVETLHGAETLARVQADVEEALALGIHTTPMVFLNGVELRGWRAPDALRRAVLSLAASRPAASGAEADRPPDALTKGLEDWRSESAVALPVRAGEDGVPEIALWGDYFEPETRELDRELRAFLAARPDLGARYSYRHYPLDRECVPSAPNLHPGACLAARAAEAARQHGDPAFERLHAWLMSASAPLDEARLREGAAAAGLDPAAFLGALAGEAARAAVQADVEDARRLGIHKLPMLYVAGKRVPRWRIEGAELLGLLLDEALTVR